MSSEGNLARTAGGLFSILGLTPCLEFDSTDFELVRQHRRIAMARTWTEDFSESLWLHRIAFRAVVLPQVSADRSVRVCDTGQPAASGESRLPSGSESVNVPRRPDEARLRLAKIR